jgi:hypothetical protein
MPHVPIIRSRGHWGHSGESLFSLEWLFSLGFWFPGQLRQSWLGLEERRFLSVRFPGHSGESLFSLE